jgi:hypothetical protein
MDASPLEQLVEVFSFADRRREAKARPRRKNVG